MENAKLEYIRRMNWFGMKLYVKSLIGWSPLNRILVPIWKVASGVVAPAQTWRFPVNRRRVRARVLDQQFQMSNPMRCSIAKELFWNDGRREHPVDRVVLDVFCSLGKDADVILDIGANTGLFSIAAAAVNPRAKVHAYEIVPDVTLQLISNLIENDLLGRVETHGYGLGIPGAHMRIPSMRSASALPSALSSKISFASGNRVEFQSLDAQRPFMHGHTKALLKIDVEGTEDDIFRFGHEFTSEFLPDIVCEILPDECNMADVAAYLQFHQYNIYKFVENGLSLQQALVPDARHHDWLFSRSSPAALARIIDPLIVSSQI